jgi:hypothetical protein
MSMPRSENLFHDPEERVLLIQPSLHLRETGASLFTHWDKTGHGPVALQNGDGLLTVGDPPDEL